MARRPWCSNPPWTWATGRLLGFEALLRRHDSSGDSIPSVTLGSPAEALGRMTALNAWILTEACAQAARWPSDLQLAVDCSISQLRRRDMRIAVASALEQSGLNPDRLTVEVTETAVADDEAAAGLHAIAGLGIQLTVDNIGSDRAIQGDLKELAITTVKIDGSLIEGLETPEGPSRAIVESIVKLNLSFGMCTVAESVETAGQVTILRALGADVAQGNFFSPPLAAADAYALATTNPRPRFSLTAPAGMEPRITVRPTWLSAAQFDAPLTSHDTINTPDAVGDLELSQFREAIAQLIAAIERQNQLFEAWLLSPAGPWMRQPPLPSAPPPEAQHLESDGQAGGT